MTRKSVLGLSGACVMRVHMPHFPGVKLRPVRVVRIAVPSGQLVGAVVWYRCGLFVCLVMADPLSVDCGVSRTRVATRTSLSQSQTVPRRSVSLKAALVAS